MNPQFIHMLYTALPYLFTLGVLGYVLYTRYYFTREIPSRSALTSVERKLFELEGIQSDLESRFTRLQKREGMRVARSAKENEQAIREEATQILNAQGPAKGLPGKLGLYQQARR